MNTQVISPSSRRNLSAYEIPIYPLVTNQEGATQLVAHSPEAALELWNKFMNPWDLTREISQAERQSPQRHIWALLNNLAQGEYAGKEESVAIAVNVTAQMAQLVGYSSGAMNDSRLFTDGCRISETPPFISVPTASGMSVMMAAPPIGWFSVNIGAKPSDVDGIADINFRDNSNFVRECRVDFQDKDNDNAAPNPPAHAWAWSNLGARLGDTTGLTCIISANYRQDKDKGICSQVGNFNFSGLASLFPPSNTEPKPKSLTFRIEGESGEINNWNFKQDRVKGDFVGNFKQGRVRGDFVGEEGLGLEKNALKLNFHFVDTSNKRPIQNLKFIDCNFFKEGGANPTQVSVKLASSFSEVPVQFEHCSFRGIDLRPNDQLLVENAFSPAHVFKECNFRSVVIDIRDPYSSGSPVAAGVTFEDCFGSDLTCGIFDKNILEVRTNPWHFVHVAGSRANSTQFGEEDKIVLSIWVDSAPHKDVPFASQAAPTEVALMDISKSHPVSLYLDGSNLETHSFRVIASNISLSSLRLPAKGGAQSEFIGFNIIEKGHTTGMDFATSDGKQETTTPISLSYSPEMVLPVSTAVTDIADHAEFGDLNAWGRARTIGLLQATVTEDNVHGIASIVQSLNLQSAHHVAALNAPTASPSGVESKKRKP